MATTPASLLPLRAARGLPLALFALLPFGAVPLQAGDSRPTVSSPLGNNNAALETRLEQLERRLNSSALIGMLEGIEQLRFELAELRGQLEVQGNELNLLKQRQRDLLGDLDARLQSLEAAGVPVSGGGAATAAPDLRSISLMEPQGVASEPIQATSEVPTLESSVSLLGEASIPGEPAQQPISSVGGEQPQVAGGIEVVDASREAEETTALLVPAAGSGVGGDSADLPEGEAGEGSVEANPQQIRQEYQRAFNLLRERQYAFAIEAFHEFSDKYPSSDLGDKVAYWTGESHYVLQQYELAIAAYRKLIQDYPQSPRLANALLKIAYCYQAMGDMQEATTRLNDLINKHPNTTAARLASDRLKKL